jgi:hypothetical protein
MRNFLITILRLLGMRPAGGDEWFYPRANKAVEFCPESI